MTGPKDFPTLERFIATRANDIQLTPARSMKTSNPEAISTRCFDELVDGARALPQDAAKPRRFADFDEGLKGTRSEGAYSIR